MSSFEAMDEEAIRGIRDKVRKTEAPKALWSHPMFKTVLREALDNDRNTFELDGKHYEIREANNLDYWLIVGIKGTIETAQVEKDKAGRKGAEWY